MNLSRSIPCVLIGLILLARESPAQPMVVKETNTPIALHYGEILKGYLAFIQPKMDTDEELIEASKAYFNGMKFRLVKLSIEQAGRPGQSISWKIPHSKMAVLPRITCSLSPSGATVELYDQGDDYILLQHHTDKGAPRPGLFISVGITHGWK
ncbi:MAG: hypothetical protein ACOZF0_07405 [Thermodesulfobacteriota bacterium]